MTGQRICFYLSFNVYLYCSKDKKTKKLWHEESTKRF